MNKIKLFTAAAAFAIAGTTATACEYKNHTFNFDFQAATPVEGVCEASIFAIKFFEELGYSDVDYTFNVTVADEVYSEVLNEQGEVINRARVFGLYNGETNQITISALGTDYMNERTAWNTDPADDTSGIEITEEVWLSVITHEVAHSIATTIYKDRNATLYSNGVFLDHGASEYLAYMTQFASLDEDTKQVIIDSMNAVKPLKQFDSIWALNPFLHAAHPHRFGTRAYLTQNIDWVHKILNGEYVGSGVDM